MAFDYDPLLRIDTARLQTDLERFGLMDKPLRAMNRDDLRALAHSMGNAVHDTEPPYWETNPHGVRTLRIPFAAPHACKWWLHKDQVKAMNSLLRSVGATATEYRKYMGCEDPAAPDIQRT